jgi:hypothetical protein
MVATLMLVSVTPASVAPVALPGPHTDLSVPKFPDGAAAWPAVWFPEAVVPLDVELPDRPQAPATRTEATITARTG